MRFAWLILAAGSLVAGCVASGEDDDTTQGGNGKADGDNGSCTAPQYGDGTCQIDIACDVPDIDCYTQFDNDDAAAAWLQTLMPSTVIPATDPRVARSRDLVNRAYELFKSRVQLGKLAEHPLAVVVIEGDANAFILGDPTTKKGGWSVQVQTGILDGTFTDDQIIGIMQHELTHLAKLHFLPEVTDRIRKFYIAPDGKEPIGETSAENLIAKEYGDQWRKASLIAGYFTNPELGGLPFSGDLGNQFYYYVTEKLAGPCPTQVEAYKSLYTKLVAGVSKLDYSLTVDPALALQIQPTLDGLRQCGVVDTQTLRAYLTADSPDWIPYIEPALTPEEVPLLDKPVIEALTTLFAGRRATLIALQNKFTEESSWPWSSLRFYSYEEAADDNWVRIYQSARLDGGGVFKSTFEHFLGDQAPACEMKLATNTAPYGVDYFDEHHSDCWRIEHAALIAAPTQATRTIESDDLRVPHEPRNVPQRPGPHPIY